MSNRQGKKHGTIVMSVLALALVLVAVTQTGAQVDNKIHGGVNVRPGELPFLASLTKNGKIWCGGSIIDEHHILTAAHCIRDDLVLKLGCHELSRCKNEYKISGHLIHPSYPFNESVKNDIAILRTEKPIRETGSIGCGSIGFIELPEMNDLFAGDLLTVAGWGETGNRIENEIDVPMKVNVSAIGLQECMSINYPGVDYSQICAGSFYNNSCRGDSGGPLFRTNEVNGRRTLLGIVSFGYECGLSPGGVYTRVASFIDWIEDSIVFSQYW